MFSTFKLSKQIKTTNIDESSVNVDDPDCNPCASKDIIVVIIDYSI